MDELGVPVYPEDRVYKAIGRALCDRYFQAGEFAIRIKRRPRYIKDGDVYRCGEF